jgi:hypothetical protein
VSNVLSDEKKQQVIALGRLGWSLRRIQKAVGVRRETASSYLKEAGIVVRPPGGWGWRATAKPAIEVTTDPDVAPETAPTAPKPARRKKEPKAAAAPKATAEPKTTRDGSKTAQVVAMLQREGGATLIEIMEKMGWQKHTVRGFMAGAMKKAGYTVESFKPGGGERTYRISK